MSEKDFKAMVDNMLDYYKWNDDQELRMAMKHSVFVHDFFERCQNDADKYCFSFSDAVYNRVPQEIRTLKKVDAQMSGFSYVGLGDVFGGKMWFVWNRQVGYCEWYHTKKECAARVRQLYEGDEKKKLLSKLQDCKDKAFILMH